MNPSLGKYEKIIHSLIILTALFYPGDGAIKDFFIGAATGITVIALAKAINDLVKKKENQECEVTGEIN